MRTSSGRTGRVLCFAASILLLAVAIILLTDAGQTDDEVQSARLAAMAPVLAMGSVALMIGALVWTLAARGQVMSAPVQSPERGGYGQGDAGPPQQTWQQPPPPQGPPHGQQQPGGG
jgi:hypothetical protein